MSPRARRDVRRRSRAVEKAKKLRTFARESRRFASRRRAPGTRRVREISLGFYESRDFFTRDEIHALTPSRPYLAPRPWNHPGFVTQGSAGHAESDSSRPRNWRARDFVMEPSPPWVSDPMRLRFERFERFERFFDLLGGKPRHT